MHERSWFVIHTQAAWEAKVTESIEQNQLGSFLPIEERAIKHARRVQLVKRPFFPMYVFAAFHLDDDNWEGILEMRGVLNILGIRKRAGIPTGAARTQMAPNSKPLALRPGVVPYLQACMAQGNGVIRPEKPLEPEPFKKGERVKVMDGPFTSFDGIVDYDRKKRVGVLLDMLGRKSVIPFHRESLALAS